MSVALLGKAAPSPTRASLPDPFPWTARLVTGYGECRTGVRPWPQLWPLLDLPVIEQLWPQRRDRHPHPLRVWKLVPRQPSPMVWEVVALAREGSAFRAVAVRVEAAAAVIGGHHGPPGPLLVPISYMEAQRQPQSWLATALHLL